MDYDFVDDEPDDADGNENSDDDWGSGAASDEGEVHEGADLDLAEQGSYTCATCGEEIIVPLDISQGREQEYVEDCPVCCHPNVIEVRFDANGNVSVDSRSE